MGEILLIPNNTEEFMLQFGANDNHSIMIF